MILFRIMCEDRPVPTTEGPTLHVVGSCSGCRHREPETPRRDAQCRHPAVDRAKPLHGQLGPAGFTTPDWCPVWSESQDRLIAALQAEGYEQGPVVCPGCQAIGAEPHPSYCPDAALAGEDAEREHRDDGDDE